MAEGNESVFPRRSGDELMLDHCLNLARQEAAGVLAWLRMGALVDEERNTRRLYWRRAIQRLEAQDQYLATLAIERQDFVRVDRRLRRLCNAIACWQDARQSKRLILNLEEVTLTGYLASRLSAIAAELVLNGFRHGLERGGTFLRVILREGSGSVILAVSDNGPGWDPASPRYSGAGLKLVSDLVQQAGGSIFLSDAGIGTLVKVTLPTS
jgi:two-component sensor histidine kinase